MSTFSPPDWIAQDPDHYECEVSGMPDFPSIRVRAEIRYHKRFYLDKESRPQEFAHLTINGRFRWLMKFDSQSARNHGLDVGSALADKFQRKIAQHLAKQEVEYGPFDWFCVAINARLSSPLGTVHPQHLVGLRSI